MSKPVDHSAAPGGTKLAVDDLKRFTCAVLELHGAPARAAVDVADGLIEADLGGVASHGLALLPLYLERIAAGSVCTTKEGRVLHNQGAVAILDAEHALGQASSAHAVRIVVELARTHGIGAVAVRNGFHFGAAGRWARAIAREGFIGVALSNTRPLMPAPGGAERMVGNNPIAIAAPSEGEDPLTVDLALSAAAMGKIRMAQTEGGTIPLGWAVDCNGVPTVDPAAAIKGMLLPAAGPKGFGLAMMIDLLCGGLSGGAIGGEVTPLYGDPATPYGCAHFFLALNPAAFGAVDFSGRSHAFAKRIRASRPAPGVDDVRAPGDLERRRRLAAGRFCSLSTATIAMLADIGKRHSVPFPTAIN